MAKKKKASKLLPQIFTLRIVPDEAPFTEMMINSYYDAGLELISVFHNYGDYTITYIFKKRK